MARTKPTPKLKTYQASKAPRKSKAGKGKKSDPLVQGFKKKRRFRPGAWWSSLPLSCV